MSKTITIFTDGSSRGNPGPGGWGAVVVDAETAREFGGREDVTTNNRMELMGAISALASISGNHSPIKLHTDSSYVINGITKWVHGWQKNNWITGAKQQVQNQDLWKELLRVSEGKDIKWTYVAGHSGIPANERCDVIATMFADKESVDLYAGPVAGYEVDVTNLSGNLIGAKPGSSSAKKKNTGKAFSYLSMINGDIQIHKTWAECEARVKGVKATKFKKSLSKDDEQKIIAEWKSK